MFSSGGFWLSLLLAPGICLLFDFAIMAIRSQFFTEPIDAAREIEHGYRGVTAFFPWSHRDEDLLSGSNVGLSKPGGLHVNKQELDSLHNSFLNPIAKDAVGQGRDLHASSSVFDGPEEASYHASVEMATTPVHCIE